LKEKTNLNELSESEFKQYIYSKWYRDIEFFSDYFLPHRKQKLIPETKELVQLDTPDFHKELRSALDKWEDIDVIAPRWNAKTTAALIRITHAILYKKVDSIIYIATAWLWEEWIWKIRYELETNQEIISIFGNMVPKIAENKIDKRLKKWRQKLLQLTNWTSLETITKKASIRWKRPQKIIIDDPQENKDVKNKRIVEEFNNWVFSALYNTLLPGGSMCVLWTVVGNLCLVKYLKEVKGWKTIQYQACDENFENILWPEMRSKNDLIKRKQKIGTALFNQEFRNIPLSQEDVLIKPDWIKYYRGTATKWDEIIMAVDVARKTKESSDYTWIVIIWIIKKIDPNTKKITKRKYILLSTQIKKSPIQNLEYLHSLYLHYRPNRVIYEDNVEELLYQALKQRWVPIQTVHANTDKHTRLLQVASQVEFWEVSFREKWDEELIYQLTNFPNVEHDDIMDAFVYCLLDQVQKINSSLYIIKA